MLQQQYATQDENDLYCAVIKQNAENNGRASTLKSTAKQELNELGQ